MAKTDKSLPDRSEPATRSRLLAFVAAARALIPVNPHLGLATLAKQVGCDVSVGAELAELGVVSHAGDGNARSYAWHSSDTDEQIVDKVILKRRERTSPPVLPMIEAEKRIAGLEGNYRSLSAELRGVMERLSTVPVSPTSLNDEDRVLVEMAINDTSALRAVVARLEENVTELMKHVYRAPARDLPLQQVEVPRKWRIGIVGVHDRDWRHIQDHVKAALNGTSKYVELVHIVHTDGLGALKVPSGLDGVVVGEDGAKAAPLARSSYPHTTYFVRGGLKSIAQQVTVMVRGGATRVAA